MNFLSRLRVTVGDRVVQSFVNGGWSPLEWRADDGLRLLLECEPRRLAGDDDESEDGMSRFSVTLTIAAPGDRTSRQLVVREDGAVLSQDGGSRIRRRVLFDGESCSPGRGGGGVMLWWTFMGLPVLFQYGCVVVTAVSFGSFATTLAHRIPLMLWAEYETHVGGDGTAQIGRAVDVWQDCRCPHCHEKIEGRFNIPIVGYPC